MQTRIFLTVLMIGIIMGAIAQNSAIILTFTAENNGQNVPLDSISIENLSGGCDTILYAPDTVLVLDYITGIGYLPNTADNKFSVSQNYSNPFTNSTSVDLYISDDQDVHIYVRDLIGRESSRLTFSLQKGAHSFTIYPGNENIYLLTISGERTSKTLKLINAGSGSAQTSRCTIVHNTDHEKEYIFKTGTFNGFTFNLGDLLRYTGYAITLNNIPGSDTLEHAPVVSTSYEFEIIGEVVLPTVITDIATNITQTTAFSGGEVTSEGGALVTERGVCWSTSMNPTIDNNFTVDGSGIGPFVSYLSGLTPDTHYYVRAYATNSVGTAYGNQVSFTTPEPIYGTVSDIDGNTYTTIEIGTQVWMMENLKTTKYNNSTPIPNVTAPTDWINLTTGAYVWFYNDIAWKDIYGALYNWYTIVDTNNLCPSGWHVPTQTEWTVMTNYIGGTGVPHGNELKSCRQVNSPLSDSCNTTAHPRWNSDDTHFGTDNYGFSGLPGGIRHAVGGGGFSFMGHYGNWWSSTEHSNEAAYYRNLRSFNGEVYLGAFNKKFGFSVRCLKD